MLFKSLQATDTNQGHIIKKPAKNAGFFIILNTFLRGDKYAWHASAHLPYKTTLP